MRTAPDPIEVPLIAADGYRLSALRYPATMPARGRLVVAGATGVPQGFYRRFARYAAAHGFDTMTLDYRGIGRSKPATLKGFEMSYLDWARLDLAAAVEAMADDTQPLYLVGHSYGGHAIGLLPNHDRIAKCYVFGTGAGWHGWMPTLESLRVRLMWNLVLPVLTRWKGYSPWKMLGLGEDLPLGVYRDWRHWCTFPHYFFDDPAMRSVAAAYASVRTPIIAANALDDLWALPRSRDAFMRGYVNAPVRTRDIDPREGVGKIGHMGYFRQEAQPLWDEAIRWLGQDAPGDDVAFVAR